MNVAVSYDNRHSHFSGLAVGRTTLEERFGTGQFGPFSSSLSPVQQGELARTTLQDPSARTAISNFQAKAQQLAIRDPEAFGAILDQSFGNKLTPEMRNQLTEMAAAGNLPIPATIRFVPASVLNGALGAYSAAVGGTIFLNENLKSDPALLNSVMAHEMGHHLDVLMGGADAKGDEGRVFAAGLEKGGPLTSAQYVASVSANDHGTITVDGKKVDVEFAAPIVIWFGKAALETAPDILIGALLAQLGVPYNALDAVGDFLLNLVPVAGQAATAKKIAKIGDIINDVMQATKLADKLPKEFKSAAIGHVMKIQRLWGDVQSQIAAGKFDQAQSTWGSMVGYLREMQIASKISDKGGVLKGFGGKTDFNGKNVDIDVKWMQGDKLIFAEIKSGNDINLAKTHKNFAKKLAAIEEKFATSKHYGADFKIYVDNISPDMLKELQARGIEVVMNGKVLGL